MDTSLTPFYPELEDEEDLLEQDTCVEIDRLFRTLADLPAFAWAGMDGKRIDDDLVRLPSLHDVVESSRGQHATPPTALWSTPPYGDDAA